MARGLYSKARESFLKAEINVVTADIKVVLVDTDDYALDAANDQFLDDIPAGARISTTGVLTGKTVVAGVFDADDTVLPGSAGDPSEMIVGYVDTGVEATSRLVWYDGDAVGLTITPNGLDINVIWDNGTSRIFKL